MKRTRRDVQLLLSGLCEATPVQLAFLFGNIGFAYLNKPDALFWDKIEEFYRGTKKETEGGILIPS